MKNAIKLLSISLLFGTLVLTSCGESSSNDTSKNSSTEDTSKGGSDTSTSEYTSNPSTDDTSKSEETTLPSTINSVVFHYRDDDGSESTYPLLDVWTWTWKEGEEGQAMNWEGMDDYGAYLTLDLSKYAKPEKIGIIVRTKGTWGVFQTQDSFIIPADYAIENGSYAVYSLVNVDKTLSLFTDKASGLADKVKTAIFTDFKTISISGTAEVASYTLYKDGVVLKEGTPNLQTFTISLDDDADISSTFKIEGSFNTTTRKSLKVVSPINLYSNQKFLNSYTYKGDKALGVSFEGEKTIFRIWAPICRSVVLNIYTNGTPKSFDAVKGSDIVTYYSLNKGENGLFERSFDKDMSGLYYTYTVNNYLGRNEVVDPYAISAGINGLRGYIYNLDSDDSKPTGFNDVTFKSISSPKDLTVYEMHVKDLTSDATWTGSEINRGKFNGIVEAGTKYSQDGVSVTTGFDHLNEMKVNAVQILPFFDYANEEDDANNKYNWGYNPLNFNALDGSYSSNPYNGLTRIKEFRNVVTGLSKTDVSTRVIMDVVYNHVNNAYTSNFNMIVPGYYFRYNSDGSLANGTGVGNEVKTEAPMMSKFIVDSLVHFAKDYKIKGFRFDLMGIYDINTLKKAAEELYKVDPSIVCYGEGWLALGDWTTAVNNLQAVSDNVFKYLYPYTAGSASDNPSWDSASRIGIGCFNDQGRDAAKGANDGGNHYPGYGLISQGEGDFSSEKADKVKEMVRGIHSGKGGNPTQVVNYLSCHDNFTLFDQLNYTLSPDGGTTEPSIATVGQAVTAIYAAPIFSEGICFIQGGDEFLRTKVEVKEADGTYLGSTDAMVTMFGKTITHNSYKSSATVNAFHYDRKILAKAYCEKIEEAVAKRNELHSSILSYNFPDNRDTSKVWGWGDPVTCGYAIGYKYNNTEYYLMSAGRISNNTITAGIGSGTLKVLYSSANLRQGQEIVVGSDYKITLNKFDTVLLQRVS